MIVVLSLVVSAVGLSPGRALAEEWEPPVLVSRSIGKFLWEQVAVAGDGDVIHLVRTRTTGELDDRVARIFYQRSTDGGSSWSPRVRLAKVAEDVTDLAIAASGDSVHVAWSRLSNHVLRYRASHDLGNTWDNVEKVARLDYSANVYLVAERDTVHLFYRQKTGRPSPFSHYVAHRAKENGRNWSEPARVGKLNGHPGWVAVDLHNGVLHFAEVYTTDDAQTILYRRSLDGGTTWSNRQRLTGWLPRSTLGHVDVSAWGGDVHVAFDRNRKVRHRRSTDHGANWEQASILMASDGLPIDIDARRRWVYVGVSTYDGLMWARSKNHGDSWSNPQPVAGYRTDSRLGDISMVVDGPEVLLAHVAVKTLDPVLNRNWVYVQRYR